MKTKRASKPKAAKKPRIQKPLTDSVAECIHNALVEIAQCNVSRKQLKPCMAAYHLNMARLELQKAKLTILADVPVWTRK